MNKPITLDFPTKDIFEEIVHSPWLTRATLRQKWGIDVTEDITKLIVYSIANSQLLILKASNCAILHRALMRIVRI